MPRAAKPVVPPTTLSTAKVNGVLSKAGFVRAVGTKSQRVKGWTTWSHGFRARKVNERVVEVDVAGNALAKSEEARAEEKRMLAQYSDALIAAGLLVTDRPYALWVTIPTAP